MPHQAFLFCVKKVFLHSKSLHHYPMQSRITKVALLNNFRPERLACALLYGTVK